MKKLIATILGVVLVGTLATGCSLNKEFALNSNKESVTGCSEEQHYSYVDEECQENENISWEYKDIRLHDPYTPGREFDYQAQARYGCPDGMYAEIAIFDKDGYQIDYDNELTTAVAPYQKVILTFSTYNENAYGAEISEITCR